MSSPLTFRYVLEAKGAEEWQRFTADQMQEADKTITEIVRQGRLPRKEEVEKVCSSLGYLSPKQIFSLLRGGQEESFHIHLARQGALLSLCKSVLAQRIRFFREESWKIFCYGVKDPLFSSREIYLMGVETLGAFPPEAQLERDVFPKVGALLSSCARLCTEIDLPRLLPSAEGTPKMFDARRSTSFFLVELARRMGKEVVVWENPQEQSSLFQRAIVENSPLLPLSLLGPLGRQERLLFTKAITFRNLSTALGTVVAQVQEVQKRIFVPATLMGPLFLKRGEKFLQKTEQLFFSQEGDSMVALDAIHIEREGGLLHSLQRLGYEVTKIPLTSTTSQAS